MTVAILILAAGQSRRMRGADKLMQPVGPDPLLRVVCDRALATGCPVFAALPGPEHPRAGVLPDGVTPVWVADAAQGMGRSIAAGVAALPASVQAVMILPGDMPDLTADDLRTMLAGYQGGLLRAVTQDGRPGHPVIFPRDCFADLRTLMGDEGARHVIFANLAQLRTHPLPGQHALTDLDTPEDWAAWRAGGQAASNRAS